MKFFKWMQSKLRAGDGDKRDEKNNPKEEGMMSDWRDGLLLTIGTLGYEDDHTSKHETFLDTQINPLPRDQEECLSPDHFSEFTTEEVRSLQKELTKLLRQKSDVACDLPLNKFLNYPSTPELDSDHEGDINRTIRIILGRCKHAAGQNKSPTLGRKSLCSLINNIFLCITGFHSTPTFRDTSRMEKLMRAMLAAKKIHHIGASPTKKCMEEYRHIHNAQNEEDKRLNARNNGGFKWDKTDSEFIVLDI